MSAENASVATTSTAIVETNQPTSRIRPIPGSDLLLFRKAGDKVITEEYRNIRRALEKRLEDVLVAARQNVRNLGIHLESVGRNYAEAKPKLVVLCAPETEDAVHTFFQLDYVKTLLLLNNTLLEHIIVPQAPTNVSADSNIRVLAQQTYGVGRVSFCGTQITFSPDIRRRKASNPRLATFGGMVKATFGNGEIRFLGTSAGHAVEHLRDEYLSVDANESDSDQIGGEVFDLLDWIPIESAIGNILLPEIFHGVTAGRTTPSYDWSLFTVSSPRPNEVNEVNHSSSDVENDGTSNVRLHSILKAENPLFQDDISDPVLLLGAVGGNRRGELSSVPTRIWLAGSEGFVDAYLLQLQDGTVREGDSGAWVVHAAAPDLYGHVVATNIFGDAYVMPALQTFENMRECLGATSVTLPNTGDLARLEGTETSLASADQHNLFESSKRRTHPPFLELPPDPLGILGCSDYVVREVKTSVVISGSDHFRWIGYAFSDRSIDDAHLEDEGEDDNENEGGEAPIEDVFVSDGGSQERCLDSGSWTQDPRMYFLHCAQMRVRLVLQEWKYLTQSARAGLKDWMAKFHSNEDFSSAKLPISVNTSEFASTHFQSLVDVQVYLDKLQILLFEMRRRLHATNRAWDIFRAPGGDLDYFSDMEAEEYSIVFLQLSQSFSDLQSMEQDLDMLNEMCEKQITIITIRLELVNVSLSQENMELSRRANSINLESNRISYEISQMTRFGLEAAQKDSVEKSQLFLLISPVVLALLYFTTEKGIFSFERNAKSFIMSVFILFLVATLLFFILSRMDKIKASVIHSLVRKRGTTSSDKSGVILDFELHP
ncbi:hypothetical protein N0V83_010478 [Neocucurbitaria cava]|uniref:Uncharacterized protein n=1 Tax=Neocucurbitaria cava TaxID=798079 RepID=A0A9W9CHG0_9PLEO|nr:hypothetical protein N0V83_010478 [Neocucurbitaria cava]